MLADEELSIVPCSAPFDGPQWTKLNPILTVALALHDLSPPLSHHPSACSFPSAAARLLPPAGQPPQPRLLPPLPRLLASPGGPQPCLLPPPLPRLLPPAGGGGTQPRLLPPPFPGSLALFHPLRCAEKPLWTIVIVIESQLQQETSSETSPARCSCLLGICLPLHSAL